MESKIPTQKENPNGLHGRYYIQKIVPRTEEEKSNEASKKMNAGVSYGYKGLDEVSVADYRLEPVDADAEYFVLRLDDLQKDKIHRDACIKAILTYADEIKNHLPKLSSDLIERYSKKLTT